MYSMTFWVMILVPHCGTKITTQKVILYYKELKLYGSTLWNQDHQPESHTK